MSGTSFRSTTTAPSWPFGFENTKSVRNVVPLNAVDGLFWLSVPSIGAPSPGITTPPPPAAVGVGVAPGGLLDDEPPPDGAADAGAVLAPPPPPPLLEDRKSTRLNSSHGSTS